MSPLSTLSNTYWLASEWGSKLSCISLWMDTLLCAPIAFSASLKGRTRTRI